MKDFLKEILEYNRQSNHSIIEYFQKKEGNIPERSLKLFSHILTAHHIWNHRVRNMPPSYELWESVSTKQCRIMNQRNHEFTSKILAEHDLSLLISYKNSAGNAYQNSVKDILFHLVNHSTYHRGQIANDLRNNGQEPIQTDYIFWKRS